MGTRNIERYPDKNELSLAAARKVIETANQAIKDHGSFVIFLAGGSTPKKLYELLSSPEFAKLTDWSKWHIFIGDERQVEEADQNSNFGMAKQVFLDRVKVPSEQIHPVDTSLGGDLSATDYEKLIRQSLRPFGGDMSIDVILLGLGSDGHTLSLFPGKQSVVEQEKLVIATSPGKLEPHVDRISITLPTVAAARLAIFLVAGSDKAPIVQQILEGEPNIARPASLITPTETLGVCWMLDFAAAAMLTKTD